MFTDFLRTRDNFRSGPIRVDPVCPQPRSAGCLPGARLYVTGHSLGAAVATLAAFGLADQEGYGLQTSYVFGAPKAFLCQHLPCFVTTVA